VVNYLEIDKPVLLEIAGAKFQVSGISLELTRDNRLVVIPIVPFNITDANILPANPSTKAATATMAAAGSATLVQPTKTQFWRLWSGEFVIYGGNIGSVGDTLTLKDGSTIIKSASAWYPAAAVDGAKVVPFTIPQGGLVSALAGNALVFSHSADAAAVTCNVVYSLEETMR
jgi:hypothetical protein